MARAQATCWTPGPTAHLAPTSPSTATTPMRPRHSLAPSTSTQTHRGFSSPLHPYLTHIAHPHWCCLRRPLLPPLPHVLVREVVGAVGLRLLLTLWWSSPSSSLICSCRPALLSEHRTAAKRRDKEERTTPQERRLQQAIREVEGKLQSLGEMRKS